MVRQAVEYAPAPLFSFYRVIVFHLICNAFQRAISLQLVRAEENLSKDVMLSSTFQLVNTRRGLF